MGNSDQTAQLWSAHLANQGVIYDFNARDVTAMNLMQKFSALSKYPNHHPKHKDLLDDFNSYIDNQCEECKE